MIDMLTLRKAMNISPVLADMLVLLLEQDVVTTSDLEGMIDDPRVAIYRLRKILEPLGVEIRSRARLGYWIEVKDRKRLEGLTSDADELAAVLHPQGEAVNG